MAKKPAAPVPAPADALPPFPSSGGTYTRDPVTGELSPAAPAPAKEE
jgi:hypothetical protein